MNNISQLMSAIKDTVSTGSPAISLQNDLQNALVGETPRVKGQLPVAKTTPEINPTDVMNSLIALGEKTLPGQITSSLV